MSKILQFVLQIKDQMSSGVLAAATNVNRTFDTMSRRANTVGRSIHDINMQLDSLRRTRELSVDTRQIRNAGREMAALERQRDRLMGMGGAGRSGSGLGLAGLVKGYMGFQALNLAANGIGSAFKIGSTMQQSQVGLKTFLGEPGASTAFANIQKDAASTPYDTQSLLQVNRALISAGLSAKQARFDTMNLANAVSAVGGGNDELSRMAVNLQQIKTIGKATAIDIKQFGIAGINIYEMLAQVTGKNINQLKEMDVSYELLSAALAKAASKGGMYYGALAAQSQTMGGKLNTLIDNIQMGAGKMVLAFEPVIKKIIDFGISVSESIPMVVKYLSPMFDEIKKGAIAIAPIFNALKPMFIQVFRTLVPLFSKIVDFVKTTASALGPSLLNIANIISNVLTPVIRIVGPILGKLLDILGWVLTKVGKVLEGLTWVFEKISLGIGYLLDKIADTVSPKINHLKEIIKSGVSNNEMADFFKKVGELHGSNYMNAMLGKISQAASWADRFYNTNFFSNKLQEVKSGMYGKGAMVTAPSLAKGQYNFTGSSLDESSKKKVKEHTDTITGGGARNIYITLGKFQDQLNIHTMTVKEGVNEMEQMIENSLLRILNSANAISN